MQANTITILYKRISQNQGKMKLRAFKEEYQTMQRANKRYKQLVNEKCTDVLVLRGSYTDEQFKTITINNLFRFDPDNMPDISKVNVGSHKRGKVISLSQFIGVDINETK